MLYRVLIIHLAIVDRTMKYYQEYSPPKRTGGLSLMPETPNFFFYHFAKNGGLFSTFEGKNGVKLGEKLIFRPKSGPVD